MSRLPCLVSRSARVFASQSRVGSINRFLSSATSPENDRAKELCEEGRLHFQSQNYQGSLKCLSKAFDIYESLGDTEHQMVVGPLIMLVCQKGGLKEDEAKFMLRMKEKKAKHTQKQSEVEKQEIEKQRKKTFEQLTKAYELQIQGRRYAAENNIPEAKRVFISCLQLADQVEPVDHGLSGKINSQYGIILGSIGDFDQAEEHLRVAAQHYKNVVTGQNYLEEYLHTLRVLGDVVMKRKRYKSAKSEFEKYAAESKRFFQNRPCWEGMTLVADCSVKLNQFETAIEQHQKALDFVIKCQLASCQIESHCKMGQIKEFLNLKDEALRHYQEGLAISRKFELVVLQTKCLLFVGNLHRILKNFDIASAHLQLAHDFFTKKAEITQMTELEGMGRLYLGKLNFDLGNESDAESHFQKALELSQDRDLEIYKSALCDLGALKISSEPQRATELLQEAIDYNHKIQDHVGLMRCYSLMVNALRELGQNERAKEFMAHLSELNSRIHSQATAPFQPK